MALGEAIKIIHLTVYLNSTFKSYEGRETGQGRQYFLFLLYQHIKNDRKKVKNDDQTVKISSRYNKERIKENGKKIGK